MARDCPSSSQRSPTRQNDVTLRLDGLGQDDTFLLGDHSYDNFLDGLHDEVSFAVPKFYDQCQTRTNGVFGRPRVEAAEPVVLRALPTPSDRRAVNLIPQYLSTTTEEPEVEKTPTRVTEIRVVAEHTGKENNTSLVAIPAASRDSSTGSLPITNTLNPRPQSSNTSKIPVFATTASSSERLARAFSAFDSLDDPLNIPLPQRQTAPGTKPTSLPTSRIPALTQKSLDNPATTSQLLASTSSLISTLHREDSVDNRTRESDTISSHDAHEELSCVRQGSQTPRLRTGSAPHEEDVLPNRTRENEAPLVNDVNPGREDDNSAIQNSSAGINLSPPSPHPTQTEPTTPTDFVSVRRFSRKPCRLSDPVYVLATSTLSPLEGAHLRTQFSANHSSGTNESCSVPSSPSQNSAPSPAIVAHVRPNEPAGRKRDVGGRRSSARAVPDWVHFIEPESGGHDHRDDTQPFSLATAGPSVARDRIPGPLCDDFDNTQDAAAPNLPTAHPISEYEEKAGLSGLQDGKDIVVEDAISNSSISTALPDGSQPHSATSHTGFHIERAESPLTNLVSLASDEPVQEPTTSSKIDKTEAPRTLVQRSKPGPAAADTLIRKGSASKYTSRTKPDVLPKSRVVSNLERTRPKVPMRHGQVESRRRPHPEAPAVTAKDDTGFQDKGPRPVLDKGNPVMDTLVRSGDDQQVSSVAFRVCSPPPLADGAKREPNGNGSSSGQSFQKSSRCSLPDAAERHGMPSLDQSIRRVSRHISPKLNVPRNSLIIRDDGSNLPVSDDTGTQFAATSKDTGAVTQHSVIRVPQQSTSAISANHTPTAVAEGQEDTPTEAPIAPRHPYQGKDHTSSRARAPAPHKSVRTANKETAKAKRRPKQGTSAHLNKANDMRPQSGSRGIRVHFNSEAPPLRVGRRTVNNSAVPVMDTASTHLEEPYTQESYQERVLGHPCTTPAKEHDKAPESSDSEPSSSSTTHDSLKLYSQSSVNSDPIDSAAGDRHAPTDSVGDEPQERKKTRIAEDSVPFPSIGSASREAVTVDECSSEDEESLAEMRGQRTANAEPKMVPLVVKKVKRKSLDNVGDENHHKRIRLHGRDPRRIVSFNAPESSVPSRRPPRAPVHLPIAQPSAAPVPGEASRLRALEREKRLAERLEKERQEKLARPQEKIGLLDLDQRVPSRQTSSNHTRSAPEGPFTFATDYRAAQHRVNFEARLAHWEIRTQEAIRQAQQSRETGRRAVPDFAAAQTEHAEKVLAARQAARANVTEPKTPGLRTRSRIVQRRTFDEQIKEKERQLQLLREAQQAEEEELERLRVKELRRKLDENVKANPVPKWYRVHDDDDILILEKR